MGIQVRKAAAADIPWVESQLPTFIDSLGYKNNYLPPPSKSRSLLSSWMTHGVFLIAELDGQPVGMIAGELYVHPYAENVRTLYEHFWWVPAEHRRSGAGGELLKAFLQEARKNEAVARVSVEHNTKLPEGYMERHGLHLAEMTYVAE